MGDLFIIRTAIGREDQGTALSDAGVKRWRKMLCTRAGVI